MRYRILQCTEGTRMWYKVQTKGRFWGWNDMGKTLGHGDGDSYYFTVSRFNTPDDALEAIALHKRNSIPYKETIVKEVE